MPSQEKKPNQPSRGQDPVGENQGAPPNCQPPMPAETLRQNSTDKRHMREPIQV